MTAASLGKTIRLAAVVLCLALVLAGGTVTARSAPATALQLDPATVQVVSGQVVALALWVKDVEGLQRVELHLDYDAAGLQVQDAESGRAGVQIQLGPVFCATCVPQNEVIDGKIHFVAYRDVLDGPFSGSGIVAYISLLVAATAPDTSYSVSFDQATTRLLDDADRRLAVSQFIGSTIVLPPPLVTLAGHVTRGGWSSHERSVVSAALYPAVPGHKPISWARGCTDAGGGFELDLQSGSQAPPAGIPPEGSPPSSPACARWAFLRFEFSNYLDECTWQCADDGVQDAGRRSLKGGDVNGDGCVDISDIVQIIGDYGAGVGGPCFVPCTECPPDPALPSAAPPCDLNGDCRVNILDLTQAAGNFGLCDNCP